MMEIARSGVFHPEMLSFPNIMMLFLAVMLTDVILLDVFNPLGLPTSTTVSLVFELLGAAVAVAIFSIWQANAGELIEYINTDKAVALFLAWGGKVAIFIALALVGFMLFKSSRFHQKRKRAEKANATLIEDERGIVKTSTTEVREVMGKMLAIYHQNIKGITKESRSLLKEIASNADELYRSYKNKRTYEVVPTIQSITLKELDIEQEYVQIVDYTYEITKALRVITSDSSLYIENNHKGFNEELEEELEELSKKVTHMYKTFIGRTERSDYSGFATITHIRNEKQYFVYEHPQRDQDHRPSVG